MNGLHSCGENSHDLIQVDTHHDTCSTREIMSPLLWVLYEDSFTTWKQKLKPHLKLIYNKITMNKNQLWYKSLGYTCGLHFWCLFKLFLNVSSLSLVSCPLFLNGYPKPMNDFLILLRLHVTMHRSLNRLSLRHFYFPAIKVSFDKKNPIFQLSL